MEFLGVCSPRLAIVTEFMEGGTLTNFLRESVMVQHKQIMTWATDIALGLKELEQHKVHFILFIYFLFYFILYFLSAMYQIVHRDLSTMNILLTEDKKHCKIADFGLSIFSDTKEEV